LRRNCLLKHVIKERIEDEEEDVNSYWLILRRREGIGILKGRYKIAYTVESSLWKRL
jgi:hypothetical protein